MEAGLGLNTMSSAQLEILPMDAVGEAQLHAKTEASPLRQQMAERLAAHRQRRGRQGHAAAQARLDIGLEMERPLVKNKVAAAVAERYASSPSYRAFLAQEAERAIERAAAAAQVATRNAEAVANAQQELLAELELWTAPQEFKAETAAVALRPAAVPENRVIEEVAEAPARQVSAGGLTVRLYETLGRKAMEPAEIHCGPSVAAPDGLEDLEESLVLDEEIAFRQTPVFENYRDPKGPMEPIAANLVEFPRQLVAAKKARPRIAEGPLRDESPRSPQLRIFEVEAEQISTSPAMPSAAPEWSSIRLDAHSMTAAPVHTPDEPIFAALLPPATAPMSLRMMAVAVDLTLVLGAFVAFAAMAAYVAGQVPAGKDAAEIAGVTLAALYLFYQALFFSLSDQTPGMRMARIGFCTMTDENPSRSAMRRRILATLVAACPMGIGLLWIFLDDDRLGWHDRISRMYQRAY